MKVTDTSKTRHDSWLFGGNPSAIEAQEAQGQRELVASTQLPADISEEHRKILEEAGVEFGESSDDPLFCDAKLPKGWAKRPTEHSRWSELLDENGQVQAEIFYKAAFYDRKAFMVIRDES